MKVIPIAFLLLTNITIFGAEFQIDAQERAALIEEYTQKYEVLSPFFERARREIGEGENMDLILAARKGDVSLCKRLIEQGAKVDILFNAPLREAINGNNSACAKLLIEKGADLFKIGMREECVFACLAAVVGGTKTFNAWHNERRQSDIAAWIIERAVDLIGDRFDCALHEAASAGDDKRIILLYNLGLGPLLGFRDITEKQPLHCAAENGNRKTMDLLIYLGADSNVLTSEGYTAEYLYEGWREKQCGLSDE